VLLVGVLVLLELDVPVEVTAGEGRGSASEGKTAASIKSAWKSSIFEEVEARKLEVEARCIEIEAKDRSGRWVSLSSLRLLLLDLNVGSDLVAARKWPWIVLDRRTDTQISKHQWTTCSRCKQIPRIWFSLFERGFSEF
jgi:hypothetical protein